MAENRNKLSTVIGLATVGASITGVVSLIAAFFPLIDSDFAAAGTCLIAAALAFGLLANAVLRG